MRKHLAERIAEGEIKVDTLSEEEQQELLREYNHIATQWLESPKPRLREMAKEILALLEDWVEDDDSSKGKTLH